jgi:hypothetical protein
MHQRHSLNRYIPEPRFFKSSRVPIIRELPRESTHAGFSVSTLHLRAERSGKMLLEASLRLTGRYDIAGDAQNPLRNRVGEDDALWDIVTAGASDVEGRFHLRPTIRPCQ